MIVATYTDKDINFSIESILEDEDTNLREVVARLVELTRMIGYCAGSWEDIVKELSDLPDDYNIFDWATDTIYMGE